MRAEILAPAGDEQSAYIALLSGADAVYLGLTRFSARASAQNLDCDALARVTRFAHLLGAKVYAALNTLVKDLETDDFFESAVSAWNAGADAILIQDIFLGRALKKAYPEIELHLSTQGGCCNTYGALLAKEFGFSRVVLSRETPLAEIGKITKIIETEVFVQGALCTCFSGQCYLSSFAGNNSGNRGRCKQPCRKEYSIDRAGFTDPAFALSTADLCVGEDIQKFLDAGVSSLKIEGRLRRVEYVAAAIQYYRAVLEGKRASGELSALKRAYNRGDYTRGLAFGQDGRFLSRNVQGHIGERAGEVSLVQGKYFCKSDYSAKRGDGFKILRDGKEIGGASFLESGKDGFCLTSSEKLRAGDEVRVTTDTALFSDGFPKHKRAVKVHVRIFAGEHISASCGDFTLTGDLAQAALKAPLANEEIAACFEKTDTLPLAPEVEVETAGAFLPKSALNAFRRSFYAALCDRLTPARTPLAPKKFSCEVAVKESELVAAIAEGDCDADILIHKPRGYDKIGPPRAGAYLYLPPFLTSDEADDILSRAEGYAGIYCDGYYGISLAEKYDKKLFAGTGFNLTNRFAVAGIKECAQFFALSKELTHAEQRSLKAEGAFCLSAGGVKVMDLIYCPFSLSCGSCDKKSVYTLRDGEGRAFPLRRYRVGDKCRFELYNCAPLASYGGGNALVDLAADGDARGAAYAKKPEEYYRGATKGHAERSLL